MFTVSCRLLKSLIFYIIFFVVVLYWPSKGNSRVIFFVKMTKYNIKEEEIYFAVVNTALYRY